MNVANAIANVPRDMQNDRPANPPILKGVDIIDSPQDGSVILIPTPGFVGQTQVTISLRDPDGHTTWKTITLDLQGAKPKLAISDAQVTEGNSGKVNAVFTVSLSGPINQPLTVWCDTGGWSASSGSDYVARTNTIVAIPAGQTSATFTVQVNGDAMVEPDEKFVVWLSSATNGIVTDYAAIGTIINDDFIATDAFEPNDTQGTAADQIIHMMGVE